jgi:ankyrin repeat protein
MSDSARPGGPGGPAARRLPERPSLEQLRKRAKELARNASGPMKLADAQLAIAREYGFPSWPKLVHHVESMAPGGVRPLIRPLELRAGRSWQLPDGSAVSTDAVFAVFVAAREGDLATVQQLVSATPALAVVEYNYTPPIHFAVREGHREITAFLLEQGADPGYRSYPFSEALLTYAEDRGHDGVTALLRGVLSRRFAISTSTQAIIAAAAEGSLAKVEAELARDPELARAGNETGDTALHHAAKHGHPSVVQTLVAAGADVDAVRGDGYRPVHCALMPNWFMHVPAQTRDTIADLLLQRGARYTIFIAALRGDARFVREALRGDPSLANFEDSCHHRVLSAAVRRGDVAMTRLLLDHGANPNLPEEGAPRGVSLWIAVNDRQREIVRMLLAHGADPNAEVDSSGTPMSRTTNDKELFELLRAHGGHAPAPSIKELVGGLLLEGKLKEAEKVLRANPELIQDDDANWGDGVLAGPAHGQRHDVIDLLMRLGARVPKVSKWAPEYYFKHYDTAAFLLARGMDPNHMNWHRFTLLHHMAAVGDLAKARLLLDYGADINAIDDEYRSTPLGVAARRGQRALVELLLERGADPTTAGAPWAVPVRWAERKGHADIASLLNG